MKIPIYLVICEAGAECKKWTSQNFHSILRIYICILILDIKLKDEKSIDLRFIYSILNISVIFQSLNQCLKIFETQSSSFWYFSRYWKSFVNPILKEILPLIRSSILLIRPKIKKFPDWLLWSDLIVYSGNFENSRRWISLVIFDVLIV